MNRDEEMEFDDHDDDQDEEDEDVTLRPVQIPPSSAAVITGYENSGTRMRGVDSGRKLGGSTSSQPSRYRECLKNHAVGIGGHAVDGCGEFMPAGEEGTLDALKCAACNCHRNFHRKEVEGSESSTSMFHHPASAGGPGPPPPAPLQFSPYYRTPPGYLHVAAHRPVQALALPSTSGGHSRDDQEDVSGGGGSGGRKRFRTKFSQEQKEKMLAFAERVGWRIQKHDEAAVQQFCMETCVKRHVLKVWMHNNKHTLGR